MNAVCSDQTLVCSFVVLCVRRMSTPTSPKFSTHVATLQKASAIDSAVHCLPKELSSLIASYLMGLEWSSATVTLAAGYRKQPSFYVTRLCTFGPALHSHREHPRSLCMDAAGGRLLFTEHRAGALCAYDVKSATVSLLALCDYSRTLKMPTTGTPVVPLPFQNIGGVAVHPVDRSIVLTQATQTNGVFRIDESKRTLTLLCGGEARGYADGSGSAALFSSPHNVVFRPDGGALFVADRQNQYLRMVVPPPPPLPGQQTVTAPPAVRRLPSPSALLVARDSWTVSTVAGNGARSSELDGHRRGWRPALSVPIGGIRHLAMDPRPGQTRLWMTSNSEPALVLFDYSTGTQCIVHALAGRATWRAPPVLLLTAVRPLLLLRRRSCADHPVGSAGRHAKRQGADRRRKGNGCRPTDRRTDRHWPLTDRTHHSARRRGG
jgi:hypothetical protein